ncbi:hypothetical protein [Streptomyces sp. JJ36]|uniref:hypothetical protein n=1 Tax=Streptomyces sp. JJ36 TaxID=2736645 RepID=UPI001F2D74E3|nr:hypothetical protein [Streptomyces sp. JJ36]MCF6524426.1 hypothetical protein [Streptomyces sp. JJ36]
MRTAPARGRPGRGRTAARAAALLATGMLAAGCGIRATSVPVDAGAAPSRDSCAVAEDARSPALGEATAVPVHLVCSSRVTAVERSVELPERRVAVARTLLGELTEQPGAEEAAAGFESRVPAGLTVTGPAEGDPEETLRLSEPPDGLPPFALAQLVCTWAGSAAAGGRDSVALGGPADGGGEPPRRYTCDTDLRSDPETAATAGTPLSSPAPE